MDRCFELRDVWISHWACILVVGVISFYLSYRCEPRGEHSYYERTACCPWVGRGSWSPLEINEAGIIVHAARTASLGSGWPVSQRVGRMPGRSRLRLRRMEPTDATAL